MLKHMGMCGNMINYNFEVNRAEGQIQPMEGGVPMLIKMESKKNLNQACQDLEKAVIANKFGVMAVHNLNESMAKKGVAFDRPCRIFEVCNPHQAKRVLEKNRHLHLSPLPHLRIHGGRSGLPYHSEANRINLPIQRSRAEARSPGSGRGPLENHARSSRLKKSGLGFVFWCWLPETSIQQSPARKYIPAYSFISSLILLYFRFSLR